MTWRERIIVDPDVLAGKPVIKGTRLAEEDILVAIHYATEILKVERIYSVPLGKKS